MGSMSGNGDAPQPIFVEVGAGELVDKATILDIKLERFSDPAKRANVERELRALEPARARLKRAFSALAALEGELKRVNQKLWEVEDAIRRCEAEGDFGPRFVELARAVYKNNDRRAALKKEINLIAGARIVEEKSYVGSDAEDRGD
jgi:hypothetical protein